MARRNGPAGGEVFSPARMGGSRNRGALLSSLCPWVVMADDGVVLLKNGALTGAFEFVAPDLDSSSNAKVASVANLFNSSLMQLGEGWAMQFELQRRLTRAYPGSEFTNLAGFLVERQRELNFLHGEAYYENRYYFCLTYQLPPEITQRTGGFFYRRGGAGDGLDMGLFDAQLKRFRMEIAKVAAVVGSIMSVRMLDSDALFTYLHTSVSMDWHEMRLPREYRLFLDRAVTDADLETSEPMRLGEHYIPVLTVSAFPSYTVPAMFDALNKADCELRWSTRFITYSRDTAIRRIDKAEKRFHSQRKSVGQWVMESTVNIQSTREDSGAHAQESDASAARAECTMGVTGFGDYVSNVMVWDTDLERAEDKARYVAGIIGGCGFAVKEERHNARNAFLSMQPGNVYANIRSLFVSTGNMSHVIPVSSIWSGLRSNGFLGGVSGNSAPLLVCPTTARAPFYLNFNTGDVGHHWVSGPTGAGKSTYLALCELEWLKYPGAQVIIFDKGRSARNVTVCAGGVYLEPGKDDISFAPMADIDTEDGRRWAAEFVETLLAEQNVPVNAAMRKAIYRAVVYTAGKPMEDRTLTTFWGYLDYQDPDTGEETVRDGISPYLLGGQYGVLFDNPATDIPMADWTMFEMGTLMSMRGGAVAPSLLYLFRQCERRFTGRPTLLVLDEAWVFLRNPVFAAKITEWLKVLRKKNVFVVFATQELEDAVSSPVASTIISQCGSKVYLADEEAATRIMREAYHAFGLDDAEIRLVAGSRKKMDYYYKSAAGSRQFQLGLDGLQLAICTNSEEDHAVLDEVERLHGKNTGRGLVREVLDMKGVEYRHLLDGTGGGGTLPL